jgi:hypothetical protein
MCRLSRSGASAAANMAMMRRSVSPFTHELWRLSTTTLPVPASWSLAATLAGSTRSLPTITCGSKGCTAASSHTKHTRLTAARRCLKDTGRSSGGAHSPAAAIATQPRGQLWSSFTDDSSIFILRMVRPGGQRDSKKWFH